MGQYETIKKCCLCGKTFRGWGNNPYPLAEDIKDNRCCDECNFAKVIPARLGALNGNK